MAAERPASQGRDRDHAARQGHFEASMTTQADAASVIASIARSAELDEQRFEHVDLRRQSFEQKTVSRCTFTNVTMQESSWRNAVIEDCTFVDCDLASARFDGARLRSVTFRRSRLMGVDWSNIGEFPDFSLDECDLQFSVFVGLALRKLRCRACKVTEASFERCDLTQADFSGSDLRGTRFERCELGRADFSTATSALIDPTQNKAKGAKVSRDSAALLATHLGLVVANK